MLSLVFSEHGKVLNNAKSYDRFIRWQEKLHLPLLGGYEALSYLKWRLLQFNEMARRVDLPKRDRSFNELAILHWNRLLGLVVDLWLVQKADRGIPLVYFCQGLSPWLFGRLGLKIIIFIIILSGVEDILEGNQAVLADEDDVLNLLGCMGHIELGPFSILGEHLREVDLLVGLVLLIICDVWFRHVLRFLPIESKQPILHRNGYRTTLQRVTRLSWRLWIMQ